MLGRPGILFFVFVVMLAATLFQFSIADADADVIIFEAFNDCSADGNLLQGTDVVDLNVARGEATVEGRVEEKIVGV